MERRRRQRGNTTIEMTLVGIPIIFVLISIFEISRAMWIYHTLAYAVREGTRYAIVHGRDCSTAPNACTVTVGNIAQKVIDAGAGLLPSVLNVTLFANPNGTGSGSGATSVPCSPISSCLANNTVFPPSGSDVPGGSITIQGNYTFGTALSMFWPGAGSGVTFGTLTLPAYSTEQIQF